MGRTSGLAVLNIRPIIALTGVLGAGALGHFAGCGGSSSNGGNAAQGDDGGGGDAGGEGGPGGAVSCANPSTGYAMNYGSGQCGTWRWAVKTGTDQDVAKVNLVPQVTTIPQLIAQTTSAGGYCNRNGPVETQTYELKDVSLRFEALESDGDYHIIASDPATGKTMVTEVPFPGCVGHDGCQGNKALFCEITRARAAVDAKNPSAQYGDLGVGTIIGIGFFDTDELMNNPGPTGEAPNGVELHPILAICFGQGCNPLEGY
jgi:hypothetical protein